ncbi:retrovirus-related pol polyprotein from transposon TNT 1-94 [Tanacetum coccineum]|uniref:Retrovirus-related pol polyprotein from transposon TNT 1-94 n=1 Tax=Tanacetum coccineum TaxID=301880 RepID=A0ABQ4X8A1_9ASTR
MADKGKKSSMETFAPNDKADYYSGITSITVNGKNAYELKGKFFDDLHNDAFSGTNRKDAVEHIEYYLKIIDPIKLPNVDHDKLRIVVFPISLAGGARRWFDRTKESITCWVDLTANFFGKYYPPSRIEGNNTPVIKWDPANPRFEGWLATKFVNYKTMDIFTKGALWDYWKIGGDEIEMKNTDVFDYETPLCLAFNEFNYLLKVDPDLLTKDIMGFKTYEDYKDDWIYEWNENVPWVYDKPWLDNGIWKEPKPVKHTCKPFNYKTGCSEWPTYSWREDGYCNGGNFPGAYHIGNSLHYQDLECDDDQAMIVGKDGRAMRFTTMIMMKGNIKMKLMKKDMSYVVSKLAIAGWCSLTNKKIQGRSMGRHPYSVPGFCLGGKDGVWGGYTPTIVTTPAVPATEDSPAVPEQTTVETVMNMTPENRAHFESEKEAIHLILTGIGDEIYSTVDACQTAQEMWEAIERLQQGESLNIQDVKTNLFWEFGQFTSHDGETIESYYTRFYKMMNEMIRNNLTVATMQVNVQFLQQLQPEWSRFVTIVKQQHKLDEVSYHKLFDILKQYQKEVNELRAERMAKNANPLALVATAQTLQDTYYQSSKSHKSYAPTSKASLPTRSHATTRYKGKEIAKPITPPSESASEEDSDPEQAQRDKDMQKNLALIAKYFKKIYKPTNNNLRTSSNTRNKNVDTTPRYKNDNQTGQFRNQRAVNVAGARETVGGQVVQQSGIQCFNCKEFGHFARECRKPKWVKDSTYHKEKMLLCKQAEKGVQLQAEQSDWLADTDEEIDEQELEAHYSYMAKIQEVPNADSGTNSEPLEQVQYDTNDNVFANDIQHFEQSESISNTCAVETGDSNVIPDSPDMCDNDIQDDQNDVECDDERVALANLIANLKLDVDENKKIQKQLKKANATLTQELTKCKYILTKTSRTLEESNSIRDSCLIALQNKQTGLEEYMAFNNRTVDYEKLEHKMNNYKYLKENADQAWVKTFNDPSSSSSQLRKLWNPSQRDIELQQRTRLIVESIQSRFDEIKRRCQETSVVNDTSGLVPNDKWPSDYDKP